MSEQKSLKEQYEVLAPSLKRCEQAVRTHLRELLGQVSKAHLMRAKIDSARVKTLESTESKVRRLGLEGPNALHDINDLVGVRIVCNNLEDIERIKDLIQSSKRFRKINVEDYIGAPQPSGYRALHLTAIFNLAGSTQTSVNIEIQVRTLTQDTWANLAHHDLYKHLDSVPPHIVKSSQRLASLLAVADEIAQDIREQASQPLAGVQPSDNELSPEALAFMYKRAFTEAPPDYLVRAVLRRCMAIGCFRFDLIDRVLHDQALHKLVSDAYETGTRWPLSDEDWFMLAPDVAMLDTQQAEALAEQTGQEHWDEIDSTYRSEVLAELPETLEELIEEISSAMSGESHWERIAYDVADVFGALNECLFCGTRVIDVDTFVESALEHYDANEDFDGEIRAALWDSGLETGGFNNSSLCSYHDDVMSKD